MPDTELEIEPEVDLSNKQKDDRTTEIRSDEMQEILSHVPNWMIRWGITLIFGLICLVIFISWFIKYPDVITGRVTITTEVPPIKLVSKTNGLIQKLHVKEGGDVEKGDFIAEIENPLTENTINYIEEVCQDVEKRIFSEGEKVSGNPIVFDDSGLVFGEIQEEYSNLKALVKEYDLLVHDEFKENNIKYLKKQVEHYSRLMTIGKRQLELSKKNLNNANQKYNSDKVLYENGVISKIDFFKSSEEYTSRQQEVENLNKAYYQYSITITEYEKQLNDLLYEFNEKERKMREQIQGIIDEFKNFIHSWEKQYILTAPFSGKVSYLNNFSEKQFVQTGMALFAVIPNNNKYIGYIQVSSRGVGKIKTGQAVNIKLDNFPYYEYGQLVGEVLEITQMPNVDEKSNNAVYSVKVKLNEQFITTYNKKVRFKPEMMGGAEIITDDLRLIERIFNQFRKIMDK